MDKAVEEQLTRFADIIYHLGKQSHNTPQEFPKAVSLFIRINKEHGFVHPDDVSHWFKERGWRDEDARDIGILSDVVRETMRQLGEIR